MNRLERCARNEMQYFMKRQGDANRLKRNLDVYEAYDALL